MRTIIAAAALVVMLAGPAGAKTLKELTEEHKQTSKLMDQLTAHACSDTWIGGLISNSADKPGQPGERTFSHFRRANIVAVHRHGFFRVEIVFGPGITPARLYIHGFAYTLPFLRCLLGKE